MLKEFRVEVRDWLEAHCPDEMRTEMPDDEAFHGGDKRPLPNPLTRSWFETMLDRSWTAPNWSAEYGGGGLSQSEFVVLIEEMQRINARPPLLGMGLTMIGPTLLEYGTEAQKQQHLPDIVRGKYAWCQGYSEPGAGSDLASLQTRAIDCGDHYLVNGSKIWTSGAHYADWMFCLVRTNTEVPKQAGISFLLIDMSSPGVEARPIRLIDGNSHFCETFFTDVQVPKENLVGEVDKGWTVGKRLLQHERSGMDQLLGATRDRTQGLLPLAELAKISVGSDNGRIAEPMVRNEIVQHNLNAAAYALTQKRVVQESETSTPGAATSIFKLKWAQLAKQLLELQLMLRGVGGLLWSDQSVEVPGELNSWQHVQMDAESQAKGRLWLESKAASIAGGSDEVQMNIIAKRVLGLPD